MMGADVTRIPPPITCAIAEVAPFVKFAIEEERQPGSLALRDRLEALSEPSLRPIRMSPAFAMEEEMRTWASAIQELLAPKRRDGFIAALRLEADAGSKMTGGIRDPWLLLDPVALAGRQESIDRDAERSRVAALRACIFYAQTRKPGFLRDAVVELESAVTRAAEKRNIGLVPSDAADLVGQLGVALARLPRGVASLFAADVRGQVAARRGEPARHRRKPRRDLDEDQWLSKRHWAEQADRDFGSGTWFIGPLQDQLETCRLTEAADERGRDEQHRKLKEWEELRLAERAIKEEPVPPEPAASAPLHPDAQRSPGPVGGQLNRSAPDLSAMTPQMAAACIEALAYEARHDAANAQREEDRETYERQLRERT